MRPKLFFILLALFGAYVLGAKAGESRYKAIKKVATRYWNDPQVKKARKQAKKARAKAAKKARKYYS